MTIEEEARQFALQGKFTPMVKSDGKIPAAEDESVEI